MCCTCVENVLSLYNFTRKPKNQRVKRFLDDRAPKLIENTKKAAFIRGGNTSDIVSQVLKDFVRVYCLSSLHVSSVSNSFSLVLIKETGCGSIPEVS